MKYDSIHQSMIIYKYLRHSNVNRFANKGIMITSYGLFSLLFDQEYVHYRLFTLKCV